MLDGREIDDDRFFLSPEVEDDDLDAALAALYERGEPTPRPAESATAVDAFAALVGDPAWAASFGRELAALDHDRKNLLDPEEYRTLIRSLAALNGELGFSVAELDVVLSWANGVRVGQGLLDLVLEGTLRVGCEDGEVVFVVAPADPD